MQMFTVTIPDLFGSVTTVTVLAKDESHAQVIALAAHGPDPLAREAFEARESANYKDFWPVEAALNLALAVNTEGPIPTYAVKRVRWALRTVKSIERSMLRQEEDALRVLANLPANERALVRVS